METVDFLDAVKLRHNLPSDYALAKRLGLSTQGVSNLRTGKRVMGEDTALRVAELLELRPEYVLACAAAERAQVPGVRSAWLRVAQSLAAGVTVAAVGVAGLVERGTVLIMSNRSRRCGGALRSLPLVPPLQQLLSRRWPN
jgi:transcriptional regulator with XRE-family HTH domain